MVLHEECTVAKNSWITLACQTNDQPNEERGEEDIPLTHHRRGKKRTAGDLFDEMKKPKRPENKEDLFEKLPDDIVVSIFSPLSSNATAPSDLFNVMLTCQRLKRLVTSPTVLSKASIWSLTVRAKSWSPSAHLFLQMCANAGNLEACYLLGMITFYCLQNLKLTGIALMMKAAAGGHAAAFFSLAIIYFNGSGGSKGNRNLAVGVVYCVRAATLGHVDAMRELGHCLKDGYGARRNLSMGRKLLAITNAKELFHALGNNGGRCVVRKAQRPAGPHSLMSDCGCNALEPKLHPANKFMIEWFGQAARSNLRMCSSKRCGRPQTRAREFRTCSGCMEAIYCSRACQAMDWKLGHKECCVCAHR